MVDLMYMAGMMSWEFVLSKSNPLELGMCLFDLAHEEISPEETVAMNPLDGKTWAHWLRSKALLLDTEEWDRCTEGLLAHCEDVRLEGWDDALDLLSPRDQRHREATDLLLAELAELDERDERDFSTLSEEDNP